MSVLSEFVRARPRFSRSANVERDHGAHAIEGYIPTGRAIDVVSRIGRGLLDASAGRTFSITGPHGVGKSSLAVFLDGSLHLPQHLNSRRPTKPCAPSTSRSSAPWTTVYEASTR